MLMNQTPNICYRPDVDGLRAVAVIGVLIFHAFPNWLPGGFVGVDIFFVISGFLITGILLREQDNGSFSFRRFYARRIRRIFPALFCVLSAVLIFGWFCLFNSEYMALGKHVFGGSAFIANIFYWQEAGYWDVSGSLKPLLHLWSLGIEEQFYIFFPLLLWLAFKKKLRLLTFLLLLLLASFALNVSFYKREPVLDFYAPFTRFWELLCGAVLACLFHRHKSAPCPCLLKIDALLSKAFLESRIENDGRCLRNLLSILGLGLILGAALSAITNKDFPGFRALLPTMGAFFLIAAGPQALINRVLLSHPWVVGIGLISYPLYLWHWPLLSYATILDGAFTGTWEWRFIRMGCLAVAFVLAVLTYKFVENPIRFGKKCRGLKTGLLIVLMAACGGGERLSGSKTECRGGLQKWK
ncbi:MAG: acyltransferase [Desulfovibrionaceae bacterium]|nr:acyltransferase [Desulfovibrionaceae bacterium]